MRLTRYITPRYYFNDNEYNELKILLHNDQKSITWFCKNVLFITYRTFRRRYYKGFYEEERTKIEAYLKAKKEE